VTPDADLTVFHSCTGHPEGHIGTFTPMSRTRLGCGCQRFRLRRCDGTDMHVLDGACHTHPDDREEPAP